MFAFSVIFPSFITGSGQLFQSVIDAEENIQEFRNTELNISVNQSNISITNTGEDSVKIRNIHFVVEGTLTEEEYSAVEGDPNREIIQPFESARFEFSRNVSRVKVIAPHGVEETIVVQ